MWPNAAEGSRLCAALRIQKGLAAWEEGGSSTLEPALLPVQGGRRAPACRETEAPEGAGAAPQLGTSDIALVTRHSISGLLQAFSQNC